jgi:hypothetical protein
MRVLIVVTMTIFITNCSVISIEPRQGRLPSIKVESGVKGCKWRPKIDSDLSDKEIFFVCKYKVSI